MLICVLIDREMPVPLEVEVSESPRAAAVSDVASMQRRQDATTGIATTAGIAATFTRAATFTTGVVDMAQGVADLGVDSAKAAKGSAKAAAIAARAKARELRMRRARKLEPVPWYIVHPGCFGKVLWDTFAVLILVYTVVLAPLKLGFDVEDYCPSGLWWWEAIIDTTFFCDMLLNFVTAVYVDDDKGGMPLSTSLPTIMHLPALVVRRRLCLLDARRPLHVHHRPRLQRRALWRDRRRALRGRRQRHRRRLVGPRGARAAAYGAHPAAGKAAQDPPRPPAAAAPRGAQVRTHNPEGTPEATPKRGWGGVGWDGHAHAG